MGRFKIVMVTMPEEMVALIDKIKQLRGENSRSATVRFLCMKGLGVLGYLDLDRQRALEI
ncbi:MAG: hypothetical protein QXP27_04815 [Candidatus Methanomethyliaceae archaeon]